MPNLGVGIVGLPNVGKSTLFNALTKAGALAANYPFATIEKNVGVVPLPDERLEKLAEVFKKGDKAPPTVPTYVEFVDIAGLVRGAHKGEGLGNQFLSHVREVAAVAHVVRAFADENVVHVEGSVDPLRDVETIETELALADLGVLERRLEKLRKGARIKKEDQEELALLEPVYDWLAGGKPLRRYPLPGGEAGKRLKALFRQLGLITAKPLIYVANVSEADLPEGKNNPYVKALKERAERGRGLWWSRRSSRPSSPSSPRRRLRSSFPPTA